MDQYLCDSLKKIYITAAHSDEPREMLFMNAPMTEMMAQDDGMTETTAAPLSRDLHQQLLYP